MSELQNELTAERLSDFEKIIGYRFANRDYLIQALTHSSYRQEMNGRKRSSAKRTRGESSRVCSRKVCLDYERLEFLGDAVLQLAASQRLYREFDWPEGKLTTARASLVCEPALADVARKYGYGAFLRLGKGMEKTGGRDSDSILCDVVESVLGAIYLDGGLEPAFAAAERLVLTDVAAVAVRSTSDYKTELQEYLQGKGQAAPAYEVTGEEGPPHARIFTVDLILEGKVLCSASGRSKKKAEQQAAHAALEALTKQ